MFNLAIMLLKFDLANERMTAPVFRFEKIDITIFKLNLSNMGDILSSKIDGVGFEINPILAHVILFQRYTWRWWLMLAFKRANIVIVCLWKLKHFQMGHHNTGNIIINDIAKEDTNNSMIISIMRLIRAYCGFYAKTRGIMTT